MKVALAMSEAEFLATVKGLVKGSDKSAMVVPFEAKADTNRTPVKEFTVWVVSSTDKSEEIFAILRDYALKNRGAVEYQGWKVSTDDKSFQTAIHTVIGKLHEKGC